MIEFTYVMIKPDGVRKNILDDVVKTFKENDLGVFKIENDTLYDEIVREHYSHLKDKDFFEELVEFMCDDVIKMIVVGVDAISKVRTLIGPTNVMKAKEEAPNSIRAKYGDPLVDSANAIHASDSPETALLEIKRFYNIEIVQPKYIEN